MDLDRLSWGYLYNGRIYLNFLERPDPKMVKYSASYPLLDESYDIKEGFIQFNNATINFPSLSGGDRRSFYAEPIFRWERIR